MPSATSLAVVGATGYAGQELLRRLARHSGGQVTAAYGSVGSGDKPRTLPALARVWDGEVLPFAIDAIAGRVDAAFLAVPESAAAEVGPALAASGVRVFDLSGAFRLRDADSRKRWYPSTNGWPDGTVYGLTEHHRDAIRQASLVACPGCYPTPALLALRPLVAAGLLAGDVVIDAKSGISGAGKAPSERTHFSENHGSVAAYGVFAHRHAAEIEQELGVQVTFVPHLVPLDRGILETMYVRVAAGTNEAAVAGVLKAAYVDAPFVRLTGDRLPEIKHVVWTNFCDIGWKLDPESNRLVIVAVIDNLVKGAAGQAIQNFNVAFGHDEREALW